MRTNVIRIFALLLVFYMAGCTPDSYSEKGRAVLVRRRVEVDKIRNSLSEYCRTFGNPPSSELDLSIKLRSPCSKLLFNKKCCVGDFSEAEIAFALIETESDGTTVVTFVSKSARLHSSRAANATMCYEYSSKAISECLVTDDGYMVDSRVIDKWRLPVFGKEVVTTNWGYQSEITFEDGSRVVIVYASPHTPGRRTVYGNNKVVADVDYSVDEYGVIRSINLRPGGTVD